MAVICPTVLAEEAHAYREQMERIQGFAKRIQVDLTDGVFAPSKTIGLDEVWWPEGVLADLHLMYDNPLEHIETIIRLKPNLVIVHAEAEGDFVALSEALRAAGIRVGVALLAPTGTDEIKEALSLIDHVLIFSGTLGYFGGKADMTLTGKASELKSLKPELEIGWDGGINDQNAKLLMRAGVDVLNVGGFIQRAEDPESAYAKLEAIIAS